MSSAALCETSAILCVQSVLTYPWNQSVPQRGKNKTWTRRAAECFERHLFDRRGSPRPSPGLRTDRPQSKRHHL